jgi:hypothetical protein
MDGCDAACFTRGRIPFWGDRARSPDDGHAILYFGERSEPFIDAFKSIGSIFTQALKRSKV